MVTIGTQILLTPLFFFHWGAERYGEWLLLSGIPSYLALADVGIGAAAGNDMTIRAGAGDTLGAQGTFRGAMMVATGAAFVAIVGGSCIAALLATTGMFHLRVLGGHSGAYILVILSGYVGLSFLGSVVTNGYRCAGANATGIAAANVSRLVESLLMAVLLVKNTPPLTMAAGMTIVKATALAVQMLSLQRVCPWLFKPRVAADTKIIRRLITPALAFMAFPASNALLLQGPLLILGSTLGGTAIATFSAFRTVARVPVQLTNMINSSVWPEMSRAWGANNVDLLRRLHRVTVAAATSAALVASTFIWIFGPTIFRIWLRGDVLYDGVLMLCFLVGTVINATWTASAIVLVATNQHVRFGAVFVSSSAVSVLVSYPAALVLGLYGIATVTMLTETVLAFAVMIQSLSVCHESVTGLLAALGRAPSNTRSAISKFRNRRQRISVR